jgi:hypothetical protein
MNNLKLKSKSLNCKDQRRPTLQKMKVATKLEKGSKEASTWTKK